MKYLLYRTFLFPLLILVFDSTCKAQSWSWAKTAAMGSFGTTECYSSAYDFLGNIYATGYFNSSSIVFGTTTLSNPGTGDNSFLVKYDSNGNVLWVKSGIGSAINIPVSVTTDVSGNAFITGNFSGTNVVFGSFTLTNTGGHDSYLVKYDPNGNVVWAKIISGTNLDLTSSVSADGSGNTFLAGQFNSPVLSLGTTTLSNSGGSFAMFVAKYDINGNLLWAKKSGGVSIDSPNSICTDPSGNALVTGFFSSPTLALDSYTLTNAGIRDIFIAKYNPIGNVLWAKNIGGVNGDGGYGITVDGSGNSYVTGQVGSPAAAFDSYTVNNTGGANIFVAKYDQNGNALWAKGVGGSGYDNGYNISCYSGGAYVAGGIFSPSLFFGTYTITPPVGSNYPMFLAEYDINGNVICATSLSSGGNDRMGLSVDNLANLYVAGNFISNPFIIGSNSLTNTGTESFFITKFNCLADVGIRQHGKGLNVKIFPNPNNGIFNLEIENNNGEIEMALYDSFGLQVFNKKLSEGINKINSRLLSPGLYHYTLGDKKEQIYYGKLSIE